ncbi:uncharacterized protein LOC124449301 [Xenia sp. Carnegie-2017]|uniref:uncharacterized protein LOC124449301 n=1 Tax=Xenia sp. Carnegie-2017 TaxID=2897299 RepID=UPI001F037062|nr:uncharacterized protein LOC124449301 [Xenia sp. Carnegie-2017]
MNAEDEVVDKNTGRKVSFSQDGGPENDNNIGSFVKRTRYLSHSPRDGPSAFMGLDGVKDSIDDALHENPPEMECEDFSQSPVFEKPVVGKSPLDASPLKKFLQQDKKYLNEDSDSDSFEETLVNSDTTSNLQEDTLQNNSPLISSNSHDFDKDESTSVDVTTSSPTSFVESVLNTSNCEENESTRGFHSLPNSPTSQTSACNASQNMKGSFSPLFGFTGDKIPTRNFHVKTNKSATVDIGMLNRSSSFVDVEESMKGKRGISKLFENDNGKKQTVLLRRQTMSGSQLPKKKLNRRSYDGSFSDTATMNHENNDEDMPMTYDAMSPNFIFLQLYHLSWFGKDHTPHAIPEQEFFHRAVKNLDRIMSYDTHKIAVIYVAEYQENDEVAILRNQYGSSRYMEFLSGLGELVRLRDCSVCDVYTGGLERNGVDGEYAYCWRSELAQVMFHIATLMKQRKRSNCHSKKLHIGNDNGQFNFVEIVIKPLDNQTNIVCLNIKDELKEILMNSNLTPRIISDKNLATLVRHMALHVNKLNIVHQCA